MSESLTSARLVRLLADWAPLDSAAGSRHGAVQWAARLNPFEVVRLRAGLDAVDGLAAAQPARELAQDLAWGQAALGDLRASLAREMQRAGEGLVASGAPSVDACRRATQDLQRLMESAEEAFRAELRRRLWLGSPRLRRLAALDAVLAASVRERRQRLLATRLLARLDARIQSLGDGVSPSTLRQDCLRLWEAELDLRLQPALGLLEALHNECQPLS